MQNRADYSAAITVDKVEPQILREIGFPWTAAVAERVRRSVSGMLQATGYRLSMEKLDLAAGNRASA